MDYPESPPLDLAPALHLVAARTSTGSVTFFATRRPTERLIHLGTQLVVDRRLAVPSPHAEAIVEALRADFAEARLTQRAGQPYFLIDWEAAEQAISEFDHTTGKRVRRAGISVGDTVMVMWGLADDPPRLRAQVLAISGKRYMVRLEKPAAGVEAGWATRNLLKPIVRVPAWREGVAA